MAIQLTGELERRLREAARRRGTDVESTVATLLATYEGESEARRIREETLRQEFAEAMQEPLFVEDLNETMRAYESVDMESARLAADG